MSLARQWALAALLFAIVGIAVLGLRPLVPPDEPRYGIIAAQMAESGEWFSLRMADFRYYEKPPLSYWLMAASIRVFGESAFAIRLPAALATGVTALVAGLLCARMTNRRELGPLAFAVQATMLGPAIIGTVAIIDPLFAMWITLSLASVWVGLTSTGRARSLSLTTAGATAGLAFLTKGLLGLAIPAIAVASFLVWERRWRELIVLPWLPLIACLLVVAPFAVAIHRAEPEFWRYFIEVEHWRRFTSPDSNQHREAWWHLLAALPIGGFMWTLVWWQAWRGVRDFPGSLVWMRFSVAWILAPLVVLSLSSGKIATYILPLYAPVAVLVAAGLLSARERGLIQAGLGSRIGRWILRVLALCALVLAGVGTEWMGLSTFWASGSQLRWAAVAAALLLWAVVDRTSWRAPDAAGWLRRTAWAPVGMLVVVPLLFPTAGIRTSAAPWQFLDDHREAIARSKCVMVGSQMAHCVSWITRRRDLTIVGYPSEFDNELGRADEASRRLDAAAAGAIVAERRAKGESVAVVAQPGDARAIIKAAAGFPPTLEAVSEDVAVVIWESNSISKSSEQP
jgi:4-amino-4-deoxy-L-arabinose transferase